MLNKEGIYWRMYNTCNRLTYAELLKSYYCIVYNGLILGSEHYEYEITCFVIFINIGTTIECELRRMCVCRCKFLLYTVSVFACIPTYFILVGLSPYIFLVS